MKTQHGRTMNCDWVKANVTLYVYDELPDDARYEIERHVSRCRECAAELDELHLFRTAMSALAIPDVSPNFLTASRLRLSEALALVEPHHGWHRWILEPAVWFRQIRLAPAAAALLFLIGFGAGIGATYRLVGGDHGIRLADTVHLVPVSSSASSAPAAIPVSTLVATPPEEASIVGIRGITQQADSGRVDIKYDTIVPQRLSGSPDEPRIEQLLLFAARNNASSGVHVDSVDLLARRSGDQRIRKALMYALQHDNNPGVRLKSLEALGPFAKGDLTARDAVLQALLNDPNLGVRTQAIQWLRSVRADASVRRTLERLSVQDQSPPIRNLSRAVLVSTPTIE